VSKLADAIEEGWLFRGDVYPPWDGPRGAPARALPASAFVYCIQNHDQIGNRALGERLTQQLSLDAYCLASTLLLFLPMTPLLFMGQEWAASTPFLYFTDHEPELGKLVSAGRREEFKGFAAFSDPAQRAAIPDPQARETFERSRLRWAERDASPHARVRELYRALLALRASDPVLAEGSRAGLGADARDEVLLVRRVAAGAERLLLANFGKTPVAASELGVSSEAAVLLSSAGQAPPGCVPALSATIFAIDRGESSRG
jgi:maltooligosyltrehalose trehalohydrolase